MVFRIMILNFPSKDSDEHERARQINQSISTENHRINLEIIDKITDEPHETHQTTIRKSIFELSLLIVFMTVFFHLQE